MKRTFKYKIANSYQGEQTLAQILLTTQQFILPDWVHVCVRDSVFKKVYLRFVLKNKRNTS